MEDTLGLIWVAAHFSFAVLFGFLYFAVSRVGKRTPRRTPQRTKAPWHYNALNNGRVENALLKSSRRYYSQAATMRSGEAGFYRVVRTLLQVPAVQAEIEDLPQFDILLRKHVMRRKGIDLLVLGEMDTFFKRGPRMKIALETATPSVFLHELAHYIVDAHNGGFDGHSENWRDMYLRLMYAVYPRLSNRFSI